MRISWHKQTRDDFAAIRLYYAETNPAFAEKTIEAVFLATRRLKRFPKLGHPGRVLQTYELLVAGTEYIIAYTIEPERIIVFTVRSSDRRWPRTWLKAAVRVVPGEFGQNEVVMEEDDEEDQRMPKAA
jgi:plasmid stabilization system protein ParE